MKKTVAEKRKQLLKETETHTQLKKDTEVRKVWNLCNIPVQLMIICNFFYNLRFPNVSTTLNYARPRAKTLFWFVLSDPEQTL